MSNPVLVEVTRGGLAESRHRGSVCVSTADGKALLALGDMVTPIFPRSAVKIVQALVLVESGAADRFKFGHEQLALACASHGGEPEHVAIAGGMLTAAGLGDSALECGAHWPMNDAASRALARSGGAPMQLHNNCSGKHAGFVCACCHMDVDHRGYTTPDHPAQHMVKAALEDLSASAITDDARGIDGCSAPNWAMPLPALATMFARIGTGERVAPERHAALKRLRAACAAKPFYVAGTGRFDTDVMVHFGERVFVKTGAEGVYCASLPEQGLGIAIKCDDGGKRAAELTMAAMIARFLPMQGDGDAALLDGLARIRLRNWNGIHVGDIAPAEALLA